MSVKSLKYLLTSVLLLFILISSINLVEANCYVYSTVCRPTLPTPNTFCLPSNIADGSCGNFSDINSPKYIPDSKCASGATDQCISGCCCDGANAITPRYMGACQGTDTNNKRFYAGTYTYLTCKERCDGTTATTRYNITGYVLKNNLIQPGSTVILDGTTSFIVKEFGNFSFLNILPGSHSLKGSFDLCEYTATITADANNKKFNITLSCPTYNLTGYILDQSENRVASAKVNATFNGIKATMTTGIDGYYNFSIPYDTDVELVATNNIGCVRQEQVYINNQNKKQNITIICGTYSINVQVSNNSGVAKNATVTARRTIYNANSNDKFLFDNLVGGTILVSAEQTSQYSGGSKRCYNSTSVLLNTQTTPVPVSLWIGDGTCCDTKIISGQCVDNYQQVTTTRTGSCGSLPAEEIKRVTCAPKVACKWICQMSPECNEFGQRLATNCVKETPAATGCDNTLQSPPPETSISCNPLCGNGELDSAEKCDYDANANLLDVTDDCIATWHAKEDRINLQYLTDNPYLMNAVCNLNTCACAVPAVTRPIPSCSRNPGNLTVLNPAHIAEQHAFNITWAFSPSANCGNFVDHFELSVCNNDTGQCDLDANYFPLSSTLASTIRNYKHDGSIGSSNPRIFANTQYCYQLKTVFNSSVDARNREIINITCITSGDEKCLSNHDNTWCEGNLNTSCDLANNINTHGCNLLTEKCSMQNSNAACSIQAPCEQCNRLFGLFSNAGYIVNTDISKIPASAGKYQLICPSILNPSPSPAKTNKAYDYIFGCYEDYSLSTVDKTYSCSNVTLCYDYKSKDACTQDYCKKFQSGENACGWIPYTTTGTGNNIFGKGICTPINTSQQNCALCKDPKYNRLGPETCTLKTCNTFGDCYFEGKENKCINIADMTCSVYTNEIECTGLQNVSVNVTWKNNDNKESVGNVKISGTNVKNRSNDGGRTSGILGVCRWNAATNTCFRDADNISTSILDDCRTQNPYLDSVCEKDTIAPNTTIADKTTYGLLMNLSGQVTVTDAHYPWTILGDPNPANYNDNEWAHIRTFYCIVTGAGIANNNVCYPNETLITKLDNAYIINLSRFGLSEIDNNAQVRIFYFSEDPARNLEQIKNFTFAIDSVKPNVSIIPNMNSYKRGLTTWLTDYEITLKLENTPNESSLPVTCSFMLKAKIDNSVAQLAFTGKEDYDIINAKLTYSGSNTITTKYSELVDGEYTYVMNCVDTYGNLKTISKDINIDGDITINSARPFGGQPYTTRDTEHVNGNTFSTLVSVNTSVDGICQYAIDPTYSILYPLTKTSYPNTYYHQSTVSIPIDRASGIYKYYIRCNLNINGQNQIVYGTDIDNPYFAIDDLAPITRIRYYNDTTSNWKDYNNETLDKATFGLACNDSSDLLNGDNMAWKCKNTKYCIVEIFGNEKCLDADKTQITSYKLMPSSGISLSYIETDSDDKKLYGNNPTIKFYSEDNGGNIAPIVTKTLNLRSLKLDQPVISILLGQGPETAYPGDTITTTSFITINVIYNGESNINITGISLLNTDKNAYVILEEMDGTTGRNSYRFRTTYIDNGAYRLTVTGSDDDGNININTTNFKVEHSNNTVRLVDPKMGIGSTKDYDVSVVTDYYSTCKYSMDSLAQSPNTAARYNNIVYKTFTSTGANLHTFTHDGTFGILYVICQTKGSLDYNKEYAYATTSFNVGYNDTPLLMNVTFIQTPRTKPEDNRIINSTYNATTIQVFTNQPAVCIINTTHDNPLLSIHYALFNGEDDWTYSKYYTIHNYTIDYKGTGATQGIYNYTINCTSLAQKEAINESVKVNFNLNSLPPVANIVLNSRRLALQTYNVTCTGLCMDTYQKTYEYAVIKVTDSCADATFRLAEYNQSIILRNTSQICVKVKDVLGRTDTASLIVTMAVINQGDMTINYPYAYSYEGLIDQVYAPKNIFTLNISMAVNSDCKYALSSSLMSLLTTTTSISDLYDEMEDASSTQVFVKNLNGNIATHTVESFRILSMENIPQSWMILCQVIDPDEPNPAVRIFIGRELEFYWDNTAPNYTASNVVPPRIYDWSTRQTAIINVTTDDKTRCTLDLVNSVLKNNNNGAIENLTENNQNIEQLDTGAMNLFISYITNRQHIYNVSSKWLSNINTNNTYRFNITCWNRAQLFERNILTMLYDLERNVRVNITSGTVFNGTTIPVTAVTTIKSECKATLGTDNTVKIMTSADGINHNTTFLATSRIQSVMVECYVTDNDLIASAYATYEVISDITAPTLALTSTNNQDYTCGLNGFGINVDMTDDTRLEGFYYSISGPTVDASLNNVTSSNTHGVIYYTNTLIDNGFYTVDVKAKDASGKYSSVRSITITARSPSSSILCDNNAPVLNITLSNTPFWDMIKANVSCTDDTSCKSLYYYSFTTKNNCYDELYRSVSSYNSVLTFNTNGLLCVKGLDLAGNTGYGQKNITIGVDISNPFNITPVGQIYPNVIVTNTTITNITLTTDVDAECRYSLTPTNNANVSDLFGNGNYQALTQSGGKVHIISNFNTQGLYEQYMDIICYNPALTQRYSRKIIRIVYTVVIPTINAYATPELVYDWNSRESLLTISTAPETVCTITGNDMQNIGSGYITGQFNNALTYNTEHKKELFYSTNTQLGIFNYIITCRTLGNKEYKKYVNVTYNITDNMSIELLSPAFTNNRIIDLIVQTNLISNCSLRWGASSTLVDMGGMLANVTNRQHNSKIITVADGLYTAEVRCSAPITSGSTGIQAVKSFSIRINTSLPPTPAPNCGDGIVSGTEKCDGNTVSGLNGMTCTSGWVTTNYTGGILKCKSDCTYDFSTCDNGNGWCGNNELDGPNTQGIYEQCDIHVPSGLGCKDFGFQGGSLSCNNCIINTTGCRQTSNGLLGTGSYACGNNIFESGEQCEAGGVYGIKCTSFGYDGGTLSCGISTSCKYVMSGCYLTGTHTRGYTCGNDIKEGSEQCDNTSGLSTVSCKTLGNFTSGNVSCTKDCKYNLSLCITNITVCTNGKKDNTETDLDCGGNCKPCGLNKTCSINNDCTSKKCSSNKCIADTCNNTRFDNSSETDVDCGKDCKPCAVDKNCSTNDDCTSNLCTDGKCSIDTCSNGVKDEGESYIDCGGNCTLCDVGNDCNTNSDCGSDNCVDNVCAEAQPPRNPVKLPLMIIALVFMLGSGGYIIYKTFIEKKPIHGSGNSGMSSRPSSTSMTSPMMPIRPAKLTPEQEKMVEKQREAILKKHQGRADERKSVMQKLEESLTGEKNKDSEDKDLKSIELKKIRKSSGQNNDEDFIDISKIKGKKGSDEGKDIFSKLKDIGKNEDKAFDKLQALKIDNVSKKISQISGAPQDAVKPTLNNASKLGYSSAIKLFGNVDRDMIMSGVFKETLLQLLDSGKITKEHVSNILFEYMDKGIINKGDVAKISSELKII